MVPRICDLTLYNGDCREAVLADAFAVLVPFRYVYLPDVIKSP